MRETGIWLRICTNSMNSVAVRVAMFVATTMAAGWAINSFREQRLCFRYQTKAERLAASLSQSDNVQNALTSEDLAIVEEIANEDFREFVATRQGIVVDARPAVFHRLGHVPGALSLPRDDFSAAYGLIKSTMETHLRGRLVVYCSGYTCEDSTLVAAALRKLGYVNIAIYRGGWSEWTDAGLPEER